MQKFLRVYLLPLFISLWSIGYLIYFIINGPSTHIPDTIIALAISWIIVILWEVGFRLPHIINYFIYAYIFFAIILGSCVGLYSYISFYDMLLHGFFGYVGATVIFFVISYHKTKMGPSLFLTICLLATLGMAAVWEIYEFSVDSLFGLNTQLRESGVVDTMEDIIVTLGGIILFIVHFFIVQKRPNNWFYRQGLVFANWKVHQKERKEK